MGSPGWATVGLTARVAAASWRGAGRCRRSGGSGFRPGGQGGASARAAASTTTTAPEARAVRARRPSRPATRPTGAPYGGSSRTRSKGPSRWVRRYVSARVRRTLATSPRSRASRLARITATAGAACSTSTAEAAPRDSASMARAPVPANRSSTRVPSTRSPSTPNRASLTRSLVGRVSRPGTARRRRPPRRPPTTRKLPPEVVGGGVVSPGGPRPFPRRPTGRAGSAVSGGAAVAGARPALSGRGGTARAGRCAHEGRRAVLLGLLEGDALAPGALEGVVEGLAEPVVAHQQGLGVAAGGVGPWDDQVEEDHRAVDQQVQGLHAVDDPGLEPGGVGEGGHPGPVRLVLQGVAVEDGAEADPGPE